jgi:proteasome lid subunit RPN8/RPN11
MTDVTPTPLAKGGQPGTPGLAQRLITDRLGRRVTHWVRVQPAAANPAAASPTVAQRARHYTDAQQEIDFSPPPAHAARADRPDTTPAQHQAGSAALAALERRLQQLRATGGPTATLLGTRLAGDFHAAGYARLIGQPVSEPGDLAALAQIYRDPRFETFRAIYLRRGQIVGEAAYSSRLPGTVAFPPDLLYHLLADQARFNAEDYYLLHNHPAGSAVPSEPDLSATRFIAQHLPGLRAHVVVDHNEYAVILPPTTRDGEATWHLIQAPHLAGTDFHATPRVPHDLLGLRLQRLDDVRVAAGILRANQQLGCPVLILTKGREARVDLICQAPFPALLEQTVSGRLPAILRSLGRMTGAGAHRFLVLSEADWAEQTPHLTDLISHGWLTDIIGAEGTSLRRLVSPQGPDLMDPRQPGRRVA